MFEGNSTETIYLRAVTHDFTWMRGLTENLKQMDDEYSSNDYFGPGDEWFHARKEICSRQDERAPRSVPLRYVVTVTIIYELIVPPLLSCTRLSWRSALLCKIRSRWRISFQSVNLPKLENLRVSKRVNLNSVKANSTRQKRMWKK